MSDSQEFHAVMDRAAVKAGGKARTEIRATADQARRAVSEVDQAMQRAAANAVRMFAKANAEAARVQSQIALGGPRLGTGRGVMAPGSGGPSIGRPWGMDHPDARLMDWAQRMRGSGPDRGGTNLPPGWTAGRPAASGGAFAGAIDGLAKFTAALAPPTFALAALARVADAARASSAVKIEGAARMGADRLSLGEAARSLGVDPKSLSGLAAPGQRTTADQQVAFAQRLGQINRQRLDQYLPGMRPEDVQAAVSAFRQTGDQGIADVFARPDWAPGEGRAAINRYFGRMLGQPGRAGDPRLGEEYAAKLGTDAQFEMGARAQLDRMRYAVDSEMASGPDRGFGIRYGDERINQTRRSGRASSVLYSAADAVFGDMYQGLNAPSVGRSEEAGMQTVQLLEQIATGVAKPPPAVRPSAGSEGSR